LTLIRARLFASVFVLFVCCGCVSISELVQKRTDAAASFAAQAGFSSEIIETHPFKLQSYARFSGQGKRLTVYVEGDGLAWLSRHRISPDPTPIHPIALQLAAEDDSPNVAYLARPCQFVSGDACSYSVWTNSRFSESVIASMNEALDHLKTKTQADRIDLVGYSGGAAVVLLLAERRHDITSITTISGNVDPVAVNAYHGVSQLTGSLDPLKDIAVLRGIPQRHLVGSKDRLIPIAITRRFREKCPEPDIVTVEEIDGPSHMDGWIEYLKKSS